MAPAPHSIVITAESKLFAPQAEKLAQQQGWQWLPKGKPPEQSSVLLLGIDGLQLLPEVDRRKEKPLRVVLSGGPIDPSGAEAWVRGQPLARAIGIKGARTPSVLDATAGLGEDGWLIARLGCSVTLLERDPVMAALLADGLNRAQLNMETAEVAKRVTLHHGDALSWFKENSPSIDVVYLDPMFPHKGKGSLPKRAMQMIRAQVGEEDNAQALLEAARGVDTSRIVVKRPVKAPLLEGPKPSFQLAGRSTRLDVYLTPRAEEQPHG
uniref:Ribosomal RNA small subunit methyltransferase J n=1 Tax=Magnetococcus massalia (strain MO-1) TaxID=451514 RepID=A0A1S7LDI9_MAGMO|nr:conserved UPF0341 protein of unknown function [Candidatus Magnetococcus massalia]